MDAQNIGQGPVIDTVTGEVTNRDKIEREQIIERVDRRLCGYTHDALAANWRDCADFMEPDNMCPWPAAFWIRSVHNGRDYGVCGGHLLWAQRTHPDWIAEVFDELPKIDAVTFAERYAARPGEVHGKPLTLDDLLRHGRAVFPCSCGDDMCEGWQLLGFAETGDGLGLPAWPTSLPVEVGYVVGERRHVDTRSAPATRRERSAAGDPAFLVFTLTLPAGSSPVRYRALAAPPYALLSLAVDAREDSDG